MASQRPTEPQPTSKSKPTHISSPAVSQSGDQASDVQKFQSTVLPHGSKAVDIPIDPKTIIFLQRTVGNWAVQRMVKQPNAHPVISHRQTSVSPFSTLQRETTRLSDPNTPMTLHVTFQDSYFGDQGESEDEEDYAYREDLLIRPFVDAAESLHITNVTAAQNYLELTNIQYGGFQFWVQWSANRGSLLVLRMERVGEHQSLEGKPSDALRRKIEELQESTIHEEEEDGIDELYRIIREQGDAVDTVTIIPTGPTITIVLASQPIVLQFYRSLFAFQLNLERLQMLMESQTEGFAKIHHIDEENRILVVEQVDSMESLFSRAAPSEHRLESGEEKEKEKENEKEEQPEMQTEEKGRSNQLKEHVQENWRQIYADVSAAILQLFKQGLSQNDVSVDNMGMKGGKYVLFDYNAIRKSSLSTVEDDLRSLLKSLRRYGADISKQDEDQLIKDDINKLED